MPTVLNRGQFVRIRAFFDPAECAPTSTSLPCLVCQNDISGRHGYSSDEQADHSVRLNFRSSLIAGNPLRDPSMCCLSVLYVYCMYIIFIPP